MKHVVQHFKHLAVPIAPDEDKDVFDRKLIDEVTTPDGIASLLAAQTVAIAIIAEDETRHLNFNSSETAHWVVSAVGAFNEKTHHLHHWVRVPLLHRRH